MIMLLGDNNNDNGTNTTNNNNLYYLIGALGGVAILVTVVSHCVVSLRISILASMLLQDPLVIVGDPVCLKKLSRTPWYGVSEVDTLQLAILQTYNAYALNNASSPMSGKRGRGEGGGYDSDLDKVEWRTAVSDDDRYTPVGGSGGVGNNNNSDQHIGSLPFDPLEAFLLSQKKHQPPIAPMQEADSTIAMERSDAAAAVHHRRTSSGGSGRSKAASVLQRFFTPRGGKTPAFPVAASHPGGVSAADADEPISQSYESADFRSFPPSSFDERSLLGSAKPTPRLLGQQQQQASSYGATTTNGIRASGSTGNINHSDSAEFVDMERAGGAPVSTSITVRPAASGSVIAHVDDEELCDPCRDNQNPQWHVLARGLKLQSSIFVQLLSSIRVGQSLSSVTLPVHILESRSLLEMLGDIFVNWEMLIPIAMDRIASPEERIIQMFKWFISGYHCKPRGPKKPYNPILGEVVQLKFPSYSNPAAGTFPVKSNGDRSLVYIAEQVSHHPPVTAFAASYANLLSVNGVYLPKGKMVGLNCAASIGEGSFVVTFPTTGYKYRLTFPTAYVSGIVAGTPQLELGGTVHISDLGGSTYSAAVEFLRKGWLSGSFDQVHCKIFKGGDGDQRNVVKEYIGTWHDKIFAKTPGASTSAKNAMGELFFDPKVLEAQLGGTHRPLAVNCANHPKQSRAIWRDLTPSLRAGNADVATTAKTRVENAQRLERKIMAQENREHETQFFKFIAGRLVKDASDEERGDEENWDFVGQTQLDRY
ncbi:oxysterol-binding protein, putative [Bodo saltans]|uniref:Oxysterol-binding protein, putative n=1 Tax=Bodo saltans TaxID=75058 RepID=A0A0S4JFS2_BODSA|nr:oxysterol-binding protein, putative [Bodo saltans]|eukprot:CUG90286.1 oxysterol-binding protein, putative [Bodo saltans]